MNEDLPFSSKVVPFSLISDQKQAKNPSLTVIYRDITRSETREALPLTQRNQALRARRRTTSEVIPLSVRRRMERGSRRLSAASGVAALVDWRLGSEYGAGGWGFEWRIASAAWLLRSWEPPSS